MINKTIYTILGIIFLISCQLPQAETKKVIAEKHNYIVLLDLSDRLIVQENQSERDKEIIKSIYNIFKEKVKKELYIKSRDEIKIVIAPQRGEKINKELFEDRLYINMENISHVLKRKKEDERTANFFANLDSLYNEAKFSKISTDYYGADIWKYFYEDLKTDFVKDTLSKNFLFIITDGYPIVGKDKEKLKPIKDKFPGLEVAIIEAAPRDKELEWDNIMQTWESWFDEIGVENYTLIKRKAISKEKEEIRDIIFP